MSNSWNWVVKSELWSRLVNMKSDFNLQFQTLENYVNNNSNNNNNNNVLWFSFSSQNDKRLNLKFLYVGVWLLYKVKSFGTAIPDCTTSHPWCYSLHSHFNKNFTLDSKIQSLLNAEKATENERCVCSDFIRSWGCCHVVCLSVYLSVCLSICL